MSSEDYTIADQKAVYFLTFTITDWVDIFTRSCYRMVVVDSLNAGKFDHRIKNYKVWQDTSHPILLESNNLIDQKINYIHQNPVRALIVQNDIDFIFSSVGDFTGIKGMVDITTEFKNEL